MLSAQAVPGRRVLLKPLRDLSANQKFSFRKSYKKGQYQITIAKRIVREQEYIVEFIDTPGYDKTCRNWYKPFKRLIKEFYKASFKQKRAMSFGRVDSRERYEYDSNVGVNRDSSGALFCRRKITHQGGSAEFAKARFDHKHNSDYLSCELKRETTTKCRRL